MFVSSGIKGSQHMSFRIKPIQTINVSIKSFQGLDF